jgi:hypothetical protein
MRALSGGVEIALQFEELVVVTTVLKLVERVLEGRRGIFLGPDVRDGETELAEDEVPLAPLHRVLGQRLRELSQKMDSFCGPHAYGLSDDGGQHP